MKCKAQGIRFSILSSIHTNKHTQSTLNLNTWCDLVGDVRGKVSRTHTASFVSILNFVIFPLYFTWLTIWLDRLWWSAADKKSGTKNRNIHVRLVKHNISISIAIRTQTPCAHRAKKVNKHRRLFTIAFKHQCGGLCICTFPFFVYSNFFEICSWYLCSLSKVRGYSLNPNVYETDSFQKLLIANMIVIAIVKIIIYTMEIITVVWETQSWRLFSRLGLNVRRNRGWWPWNTNCVR